jgi:hypothetical protein
MIRFIYSFIFAAALSVFPFLTVLPQENSEFEVWLGPQGLPPPQPCATDFMDMFKSNAPWKDAASHTQVFKLYGGFLMRSNQDQINAAVTDLKNRGIAIAVETGVMNVPHDPACGCGGWGNVEGYGTVGMAKKISQAIKDAGGEIKYITMDEPLYYGHYYTHFDGKGYGCHSSIDEIIQLINPTLDVFIHEFPNVIIGDIEPTFFIDGQPNWQNDLFTWAAKFRKAMGRPLAFIQLDVQWPLKNGLQDALAVYSYSQELMKQQLIGKIGIIYNGTRRDQSDMEWVKSAQNHVLLMEGTYKLRPQQVIFQSWMPYPKNAMPDSAPYTLTSLVNFYFSPSWRAGTSQSVQK